MSRDVRQEEIPTPLDWAHCLGHWEPDEVWYSPVQPVYRERETSRSAPQQDGFGKTRTFVLRWLWAKSQNSQLSGEVHTQMGSLCKIRLGSCGALNKEKRTRPDRPHFPRCLPLWAAVWALAAGEASVSAGGKEGRAAAVCPPFDGQAQKPQRERLTVKDTSFPMMTK